MMKMKVTNEVWDDDGNLIEVNETLFGAAKWNWCWRTGKLEWSRGFSERVLTRSGNKLYLAEETGGGNDYRLLLCLWGWVDIAVQFVKARKPAKVSASEVVGPEVTKGQVTEGPDLAERVKQHLLAND